MANNKSIEAVNSKTVKGGNHPVKIDNTVNNSGGDDKCGEHEDSNNKRISRKARKRLLKTIQPLAKANSIVKNAGHDDDAVETRAPIIDEFVQKQHTIMAVNCKTIKGGNRPVKIDNTVKNSGGEHEDSNNRYARKARKCLPKTIQPGRDDDGVEVKAPIIDEFAQKQRTIMANNRSSESVNSKSNKGGNHTVKTHNIAKNSNRKYSPDVPNDEPTAEQIPGKRRTCIVKPIDFNNSGISGIGCQHPQHQISEETTDTDAEHLSITAEQLPCGLVCQDPQLHSSDETIKAAEHATIDHDCIDIQELLNQSNTRRSRNRIANKAEWAREITKTRRQHGQTYIGYEKKAPNVIKHDKHRSERKMGPGCTSSYCKKSIKRSCSDLAEDKRKKLFDMFWNDMNWDQKKIFIVSLIDISDTSAKYVDNSRRSISLSYFLRINGQRKQVCKTFFLSTFGLNEGMVHIWVNQSDLGIIPAKVILNSRRAVTRPISKVKESNEKRKEKLIQFFDLLPKMESHYCRQQTDKQYLQPDFQSYAQLYRVYVEFCHESNEKPLSNCYFNNTFHSLKLGLFQPKKDRCDICVSFEAGNGDKQEYENHIKQKLRARAEKNDDKAKGAAGKAHVLLMDVQAVKLLPVNNCNSSYFKTKLKIHNFTIFNMTTTECVNYWWHEGEGDVEASMFTTCILKYLEMYCRDTLPVIMWSDGCTYQNRNQILANALLDYAIRNQKEVTQKFLVKGHTQMEVDNVHMLIEKQLKGKLINLPSEYISFTEKARLSKPLKAELLTHEDFKRFDDPDFYRYSGIRPGKKAGDPTVYDLRFIHYNPSGVIDYKVDFDQQTKPLPGSKYIPKKSYLEITSFYNEPPKITKRKYDDLQDLKRMIPKKCWSFYDNLNTYFPEIKHY